jgi:hypothetical protein
MHAMVAFFSDLDATSSIKASAATGKDDTSDSMAALRKEKKEKPRKIHTSRSLVELFAFRFQRGVSEM